MARGDGHVSALHAATPWLFNAGSSPRLGRSFSIVDVFTSTRGSRSTRSPRQGLVPGHHTTLPPVRRGQGCQTCGRPSVFQGFQHGILFPIVGHHEILFVPGQPSAQMQSSQFTVDEGTILRVPGEPLVKHVGVILVLLTIPAQHLLGLGMRIFD